jgi:DNA-binding MarR family transcriptional regulator
MPKYRSERIRKKAFALSSETDNPLDLYQHLPFQIAVVSNLLQLNRDLQIREIADLDPRELRILLNIGSYQPISSADIAYQCRMDSYTVSRAVKKLKALKLIELEIANSNKKIKLLSLTTSGKKIYKDLCGSINLRTEQLESVLVDGEKQELMRLLAKLEDKAEQILAEHASDKLQQGDAIPADQKEIIRWYKKSQR